MVASAEGKSGRGFAIVRTGGGADPSPTGPVSQLSGRMLKLNDLNAPDAVYLPTASPTATFTLTLSQRPPTFTWTMNGRTMADMERFGVRPGDYVRLIFDNQSQVFHPMHLHGHTFQVRAGSRCARKDTVIVKPLERITVDVRADNPGEWMLHCHNRLHQEAGMMAILGYNR